MKIARTIMLAAVVLAASICSQATATDSGEAVRDKAKPAAARQPNQKVAPTHQDEKYGEHEKQVFDLYLVESEKPTPLFIWIHGGGFRGGDRTRLTGC